MKANTGLTNEQFAALLSSVPSLIGRFRDIKLAQTALAVYMNRMRTGHTYQQIADKFNLSRTTTSSYIAIVRIALLNDFVPQHLGFSNFTRQQLIDNSTELAQMLYCDNTADKLVTVWDGTYIYCNKSHNQQLQKKTYSCQKMRNLVKPMICVTPNGTFIDVFGPYTAATNDAKIMDMIFEKHSDEIMSILKRDDVVLVDRGFRDCKQLFESNGLVVKMPEFVQKDDGTGQLTTLKANKSRLVTASRFVVESRNGNIKTIWHVFDTRWSAFDLVHLIDDYRIGAALINCFFQKIIPNKNDSVQIATSMLSRVKKPNKLSSIVKKPRFQAELKQFVLGDELEQVFPTLTMADLKAITLGNYQIDQMFSYCIEHIRGSDNDQFEFFVCPDSVGIKFMGDLVREHGIVEPLLIVAELRSRFRANSKYQTFVLVDSSLNGPESIIEYCCGCRHGLRTVGCCGHVITLIGYLGYMRNNPESIRETSAFLVNLFVE